MSGSLEEIESIGEPQRAALGRAGIVVADHFLEKCASPEGRAEAAKRSGLTEDQILRWCHLSCLMKLPALGPGYAQMLQRVGVATRAELAEHDAQTVLDLLRKEKEGARTMKVKRLPSLTNITRWVTAARQTPTSIV